MVWPPSSPDLNPIENLWSILKRKIYEGGRQLASKPQLWEAILTSCKEIQAETLQKLTSSMDARIVKVISKKGSYVYMKIALLFLIGIAFDFTKYDLLMLQIQ